MEAKETQLKTFKHGQIAEDTEYYKYIFKKTEKICCAVFYVLRTDGVLRHEDRVLSDLETTAQSTLDAVLESLKSGTYDRETRIQALRHTLMALESKLRVASAARLIPIDVLEVFIHEIDTVHRSLRKYTEPLVQNPLYTLEPVSEPVRPRSLPRIAQSDRVMREQRTEVPTIPAPSTTPSRRERVLNVIRDKGEVTIKDISENIKDCSEKTIQRELTDLIKDNIIMREGDRRWSKYKLI